MTELTQRRLRNESGEIMRALDRGESFVVTRNGVPVGELRPIRQRRYVPADEVVEMFVGGSPLDYEQFRADVDAILDQSIEPRF
ncbi:MAG: hypothetical protein F4121_04310 [Acidimicrobiia bacterium]|nr:hypothetical protein [Acidimicrobiia bacterium]MYC46160.1 hypothetical protein [Acidimicrobiia bacterium]MYI19319.1 hypothetical protein [Acidimicrobiia bacterium]